jgi:hypothetical protein
MTAIQLALMVVGESFVSDGMRLLASQNALQLTSANPAKKSRI